jgi:ParB family chromosome partitioning protein
MAKPVLGRGLGALLGGVPAAPAPSPAPTHANASPDAPAAPDSRQRVERVALSRIRPCPFQPRKDFPEDALRELADSIREQGIVQPLLVRLRGESYELIAGERRWRAAQLAGLAEVPVLVRDADDAAVLELALIENLQRENLNPVEEAQGYQQLIEQFNLRQEDVAAKVGRSRAAVANALRLLRLPPEPLALLRAGQLSTGHGKALLALPGAADQRRAAEKALHEALSVRQLESLVARWLARPAPAEPTLPVPATAPAGDVHVAAIESRLQERLGTKVRLRYRQGKGTVEVRFFSDDDLERLLQLLGVGAD